MMQCPLIRIESSPHTLSGSISDLNFQFSSPSISTMRKLSSFTTNRCSEYAGEIPTILMAIYDTLQVARRAPHLSTFSLAGKPIKNKRADCSSFLSEITDRLVPLIDPATFSNNFKTQLIVEGVVQIGCKSSLLLNYAFMRFQEFFESPEFAGKKFSREEFTSWYANSVKQDYHSYYNDWAGFNLPSRAISGFIAAKFDDLEPIEKYLLDTIINSVGSSEKFYVIGTNQTEVDLTQVGKAINQKPEDHDEDLSTVEHELAHALYYLNDHYKNEVDKILTTLAISDATAISQNLIREGYTDDVILDETHAYLLHFNNLIHYYPNWQRLDIDRQAVSSVAKKLQGLFLETVEYLKPSKQELVS